MQAQQQKRLRATFDHKANPHRLYVEVETDGSLNPQEVVMKVPSHYHIFFILLCEIMTRIFSNIITLQGLTELQTELVLGLKSDPTELDTRWRRRRTTPTGQRHDAGTGSTPKGSRVGAVGEPLQRVGVPHGVEAQVQGHLPQQGGGASPAPPLMQQHLVLVRGVQQAVAGGQAMLLETLLAGVARIKHRALAIWEECTVYCLEAVL